jgi:MerR family transcriptional regulator, light-induced transcriptional regulator
VRARHRPALRQIGDSRATGGVTIAQEHRASVICERLLALRSHQVRGRPRGGAIVTTPPGERHGLLALMAAACLRQDRWHVHHAACDLPVAEVTQLARDTGARLIVLSVATADAARLAREEAAEICAADPALRVLTGAPGASLRHLLSSARQVAAERAGAA